MFDFSLPGHSLSQSQRSSWTRSLSWHCSPPWAASCPTDRTLGTRKKARAVVRYLERVAYAGPQVEEQEDHDCHGDHMQSTGKTNKHCRKTIFYHFPFPDPIRTKKVTTIYRKESAKSVKKQSSEWHYGIKEESQKLLMLHIHL